MQFMSVSFIALDLIKPLHYIPHLDLLNFKLSYLYFHLVQWVDKFSVECFDVFHSRQTRNNTFKFFYVNHFGVFLEHVSDVRS